MIKILFFIDELTGGGAEKVLRTLVNNMDQKEFQITVHTINAADPTGYLVPGIRYKAINRCKTAWGKKLFSYWVRLCAELKWLYPLYIKDDYDIEVAYLECGPTKIIAGSTNKKAKKIAWVHCDLAKRQGLVQQAEKIKKYYDAYDKVVCVAGTVKDSFQKVVHSDTETVVLHNVIDEARIRQKAKEFVSERENVPLFAAVGRLSYEKGNDRLLEACRRLKETGYDFRLWIIGEGPEREHLEKQIQELDLQQQVKLWGFQANPYPFIFASDFVVIPSRYEGFSTVATEALILGRTIVTTPCSGMDELLGNSEFGLITEDTPEGLYTGLKKMLDDKQLLVQYTLAAKHRGMDFARDAVLQKTERFFLDEIGK